MGKDRIEKFAENREFISPIGKNFLILRSLLKNDLKI
jgi:hypothetical protein